MLTRVFELEPLPVQLDQVKVERTPTFAEQRRRGFEQRRAAGRGYFLTEEQIQRQNPPVARRPLPPGAGCAHAMPRASRECRPDFVVDGFEATNSTSLDMPTIGITGIEVYGTLSEPHYNSFGRTTCAALL
jgi:hypothetical protein